MSDPLQIQAASEDPRNRREARQAAVVLEVLQDAVSSVADGQPADVTLTETYRRRRELGSRDRRLISQVVFSWFRWRGWLPRLPLPRAAAIAAALDSKEKNAVLDRLAGEPLAPLGALSLADRIAAVAPLLGGTPKLTDLVPDRFAASLPPEADLPRLIESLQARPPTWLRSRHSRRDEVLRQLARAECPATQDARMPDAICCPDGVAREALDKLTGRIAEIQDIASQVVGLVCAARREERWWDACAGSGGKTLHLADLMEDRGQIVAGDVRPAILEELERRVRKSGFECIRMLRPGKTVDGLFDGVLVDAPCSGYGTWSRNPDMRWRSPVTLPAELQPVQAKILDQAASVVRSGGRLVYAVCTFTKLETVDQVAAFATRHPEFVPEPFSTPFGGEAAAARQLWPWEGPGDGMFIARWRKR